MLNIGAPCSSDGTEYWPPEGSTFISEQSYRETVECHC